jgi:hypothetical protein
VYGCGGFGVVLVEVAGGGCGAVDDFRVVTGVYFFGVGVKCLMKLINGVFGEDGQVWRRWSSVGAWSFMTLFE